MCGCIRGFGKPWRPAMRNRMLNTCNRQGGVCTLDWPFDPRTGLLKQFGIAQLKRVARAVKRE
jgi:hypothetical protein